MNRIETCMHNYKMYGATWKSSPLTNMGPTLKEYGCTPTEFCENQSSIPNEFLNFSPYPEEFHVPQQGGDGWVQV